MINLKDKNIRRHLVQKYLDAETSPIEEKMLADYYAESKADAEERDIAALILSGSIGLDSILDAGNKAFEDILADESVRTRRKRDFRRYSFFALAACIAALMFIFRNTSSTSGVSPTLTEKNKGGMVADEIAIQVDETRQEPEISGTMVSSAETMRTQPAPDPKPRTRPTPATKSRTQPAPDLIAESRQPQKLRFEDVFPASRNSPDPELMFEIEEELQQRLLTEALEREVEVRMASIMEERETVNL